MTNMDFYTIYKKGQKVKKCISIKRYVKNMSANELLDDPVELFRFLVKGHMTTFFKENSLSTRNVFTKII